jgi:hypothetical protein
MKKVAQTVLGFKTEIVRDRKLEVTAHGGLVLALEMMRAVIVKSWYRQLRDALGYRDWKAVRRAVESVELLIAAGGEHLDDVEVLRQDKGFCRLVGFMPTSATQMKAFLYGFHQDAEGRSLNDEDDALLSRRGHATLREEGPGLRALADLNREVVRRLQAPEPRECATLDVDATIVEAHKRGALVAYEGTRGYQPQMAWWAEQRVWVGDQFRDGNVPAEMDCLGFVKAVVASLPGSVKLVRLRGDSALYNESLLTWAADEAGIEFAVSADMSEGLRAAALAVPEGEWRPYRGRRDEAREEREVAEVVFVPAWKRTNKKKTQPLRYIAIRVRGRQRDILEGDGERWRHFAVVTNMSGDAADLLRWQREKQGTVEHGHGVMKNDLAGGVLPCGRFGANAAWWRLNVLMHNLLELLKRVALPESMQALRPKGLRFRLLHLAGVVVRHARQVVLRLAESPCAEVLEHARLALGELARGSPA